MSNEKTILFAENVQIVQSYDANSQVDAFNMDRLHSFTGDYTQTVCPNKDLGERQRKGIKRLFGSWVECEDDEKHLEEIYKTRLIPSSMPDEE